MTKLQIASQDSSSHQAYFLAMPVEVIEEILQKLSPNLKDISQATRTCRYLYEFLPRFLLQNERYLSSFLSQTLQNRRIGLPLANLRAEFYPHPIELTLTCDGPEDVAQFAMLVEKFPNLKSLHIVVNNKELFSEVAILLSQRAQSLSHLTVAGSVKSSDIAFVTQNCKSLVSLDLGKCTCDSVYDIQFALLADIRSASLQWLRLDPASFGFNRKPYEALFSACPQLEYIQLAHRSFQEKTLFRGNRSNSSTLIALSIEILNKGVIGSFAKKPSVQDLRYSLELFLRIFHSASYDHCKKLHLI